MPASTFEHFEVYRNDDVAVLYVVDPIRPTNFGHLDEELLLFVNEEKPAKLLIDLYGISWFGTAVTNALVRVKKHVQRHGGKLKLCRLDEHARAGIRTLNLEGEFFDIYDSTEDALAAFQDEP